MYVYIYIYYIFIYLYIIKVYIFPAISFLINKKKIIKRCKRC